MAIKTKDVLGTDSISASRITLNDNINTLKEALNDVLSIIDTSTGAIDNSAYGSLNTTKTKGITVTTTGITVQAGGITVSNGDLNVSTGKIKLQNVELTYSVDGSSTKMAVGASGMSLPSAGATGDFATPTEKLFFYDESDNTLKFYNGTEWKTIATV